MIYSGGLDSPRTGILVTIAVAGLAAAIAAHLSTSYRDNPRARSKLNLLWAMFYAPLAIVAVDELPKGISPSKPTAQFELALVLVLLACLHSIVARDRRPEFEPDATDNAPIVERAPPSRAVNAHVLANSGITEYRDAIYAAEQGSKDFAYIQYRIAPYFLSDDAIMAVARDRFGEGSASITEYLKQHDQRRQAFYAMLAGQSRYREVFPRQRILSYIATGTHLDGMWPLSQEHVVQLLVSWKNAILRFPNYNVGIADEDLPLKYHVLDGECLIFHEPIGTGHSHRLNSIMIYDQRIASAAMRDFEHIWDAIDPRWSNSDRLASWIDDVLVPLARKPRRSGRSGKGASS